MRQVLTITFKDSSRERIMIESHDEPEKYYDYSVHGWVMCDGIKTDKYLNLSNPDFSYEKFFGKKIVNKDVIRLQ